LLARRWSWSISVKEGMAENFQSSAEEYEGDTLVSILKIALNIQLECIINATEFE
jgi:hypothetical protein